MEDRTPKHSRPKYSLIAVHVLWMMLASIIINAPTSAQSTLNSVESSVDAPWIWSPRGAAARETYFRKRFTLVKPEKAQLTIAARDEFEVYINGQMVASGQSFGSPTEVDVVDFLSSGVNLIAVKAEHVDSDLRGLSFKLRVKERNETRFRVLKTDATWKSYTANAIDWQKSGFRDMSWLSSKTVTATAPIVAITTQKNGTSSTPKIESPNFNGSSSPKVELVSNAPPTPKDFVPAPTAKAKSKPAKKKVATDNRYRTVDDEFSVSEVIAGDITGSLIAMEFNEFGKLLLSREGGPLLIADINAPENDKRRVQVYCDEVSSCQGILALNGDVYVTAEGPDGQGLYQLTDADGDGQIEVANTLLQFTGKPSEHGAHGIQLGPDGMLYVVIGNGSQLKNTPAKTSPYQFTYEGDVVPKYEDPTGQATNVKAPGGTVIRVAVDGSKVETVAGGIRNAYDLVFDQHGELFIHDSDMEGDRGTTWYRPPMVFNVTAGSDMGWRSGSSKFPQHYLDQNPMVCDTQRGSPSGAVLYQHLQFPAEYQNSVFLADWSEGKILTLKKKRQGAGYIGETKTFLSGRPMNVCDLAVGEDGSLYFCTGGRGTNGGVYRVTWNGEIPAEVLDFNNTLSKLVRHPQPNSAWARQNIAELRREMGDTWDDSILGIVQELRNPTKFRVRAIHMMVWYGPKPNQALLQSLLNDEEETVRSAAITLCESQPTEQSRKLLIGMLNDPAPIVRRRAGEGLMRFDRHVEVSQIVGLLKSDDRVEALTGRRLLERIPSNQWKDDLVASNDLRVFIQAATALMTVDPTLPNAYKVLAQSSRLTDNFVSDEDFVDILRVMQIAMAQGNVDPAKVPAFVQRIGDEFPTSNPLINQELAKLMGALKTGNLDGRIEAFLADEKTSHEERFQAAVMIQHAGDALNANEHMAIRETIEQLKSFDGGGSYVGYLNLAAKDASRNVDMNDIDSVIAGGDRWPETVLASFGKMPMPLTASLATSLMELDQKMVGRKDLASKQVRLGIIALLAREKNEQYMKYLRGCWDKEQDRRADIAIGLAQMPDSENWSYLVASLPELDDLTGREVLETLTTVGRRPRDPLFYRTAIQLGFRLRQQGSGSAVALLEHWTGNHMQDNGKSWRGPLVQWSQWYEETFPQADAIALEKPELRGRYSADQISAYIENNGLGDPRSGHDLFSAAQCSSCHQFNGDGLGIGPELTSVSARFSIREMIEATIDPHKNVADRFRAKTLLTTDGQQFTGLVIDEKGQPLMVMTSDGSREKVARDEVENIRESKFSHMPEGLLDDLSMSQISDLFAYLANGSRNNMANRTADGSTTTR